MGKLILMSVLIATIAIPMVTARDKKAPRGMRRTITWFVVFLAFYVFACIVIYPRLG